VPDHWAAGCGRHCSAAGDHRCTHAGCPYVRRPCPCEGGQHEPDGGRPCGVLGALPAFAGRPCRPRCFISATGRVMAHGPSWSTTCWRYQPRGGSRGHGAGRSFGLDPGRTLDVDRTVQWPELDRQRPHAPRHRAAIWLRAPTLTLLAEDTRLALDAASPSWLFRPSGCPCAVFAAASSRRFGRAGRCGTAGVSAAA